MPRRKKKNNRWYLLPLIVIAVIGLYMYSQGDIQFATLGSSLYPQCYMVDENTCRVHSGGGSNGAVKIFVTQDDALKISDYPNLDLDNSYCEAQIGKLKTGVCGGVGGYIKPMIKQGKIKVVDGIISCEVAPLVSVNDMVHCNDGFEAPISRWGTGSYTIQDNVVVNFFFVEKEISMPTKDWSDKEIPPADGTSTDEQTTNETTTPSISPPVEPEIVTVEDNKIIWIATAIFLLGLAISIYLIRR